jgi:hypothetical protein
VQRINGALDTALGEDAAGWQPGCLLDRRLGGSLDPQDTLGETPPP